MKECDCDTCKNACKNRPGWFLPEQINNILDHFDVDSIEDLVDKRKVIIDYWNNDDKDILLLAPNIKGNNEIYYPAYPGGECIFFDKQGKCDIYNNRPYECSEYLHGQSTDTIEIRHELVKQKWSKTDILEEFRNKIKTENLGILDMMSNIF